MQVYFEHQFLAELYTRGKDDKKHRYHPQIIRKYIKVVDLMIAVPNIDGLVQYNSLNYKKLKGDKQGLSSVRVNDQYRIEFEETVVGDETVASIVNIVDLSNHYK